MVMFEVTTKRNQVAYDNPGSVRDKLFSITMDPEIAIDCGNWCEIASVGERYVGRDFTVEVVERR